MLIPVAVPVSVQGFPRNSGVIGKARRELCSVLSELEKRKLNA